MRAARKSVRPTKTAPYDAGKASPNSPEAQPSSLSHSRASADDIPAPIGVSTRKRRPPNAFILFRSFIIANKLLPPELTHQTDVSRYIAEKWRSASATDRHVFFRMAEEKKREFESDAPGDAVIKKRTRERKRAESQHPSKSCTLDVQHCPAQSSPSDAEPVYPQPQIPHPFPSHSSQINAVSLPPLSFGADKSGSPCPLIGGSIIPSAPQPIRAIPPSLLKWEQETDVCALDFGDQVSREFQLTCESSSSASSFSAAYYEANAECSTALNTAFGVELDLFSAPNVEISWPMSTIQEAPDPVLDHFSEQMSYIRDAYGAS